ncbi:hypothetical protein [Magnetovibrio sp.]|uniref:hypothetical protein n=1 Tax=Magnetovibrio sp. TaxID=2024836 RepID=UPI002F9573E6
MNSSHILELNRSELAELILVHRRDTPTFRPQSINPWMAMSLMQKAIRRGEVKWALTGAATLLQDSPERLWRRLGITAFEDIGVGDFDAVALTTAGLTGKVWRKGVGGEWAVASFLVQRLCRSVKCRAADDLAMVCMEHPSLEADRIEFAVLSTPDLMEIVTSEDTLSRRSLALWFVMGTDRYRGDGLQKRRGEPQAVMDALCDHGYPDTVVEVCREGLKKTGEILPAFIPLLWRELEHSDSHVEPDNMPPEKIINGVPSWAYGFHTRDGKSSLRAFRNMDCETTRWLKDAVPAKDHGWVLGELLFRVESGGVDQRLQWTAGNCIRHMADFETHGIAEAEAKTGLALFRKDLPLLNEARHNVISNL